MKKNYIIALLLIFALGANLNAQFRELADKSPAFHLKFGADDIYPSGKLISYGTERTTWLKWDSTLVENDTIRGHSWGGAGSFEVFDFQTQVVSSDNFEEVFGPTIFWPSWKSEPTRANGIAAYSDGNGGYMGPAYDVARTIAFYTLYTDTAITDTDLGKDGGAHRLYDAGKWNLEGGGGMIRWLIEPSTMQFRFDWGGANDYSDVNVFNKGEWTHLALTIPEGGARDGVKLYVNGVPTPFVPDSASGTMTNLYTTPTAGWDGIRICNVMNAWMADYRVYDAELSEDEIRELLGLFKVSTPSTENQELFNIYPVPNNGIFKVQIANPGVKQIVVRNVLGQIVYDQNVDQNETVNVSHLASGMYFVSLSENNRNLQTKKILIK